MSSRARIQISRMDDIVVTRIPRRTCAINAHITHNLAYVLLIISTPLTRAIYNHYIASTDFLYLWIARSLYNSHRTELHTLPTYTYSFLILCLTIHIAQHTTSL